jgi:GTP-binding protein HflX
MKTSLFEIVPDEPQNRKAVLVGVELPNDGRIPISSCLDELTGLAETAEYQPTASLYQRLTNINPGTLLGSGKVEELKQAVNQHSADVVIFDADLSPRQTRNLEKELKCRVIDRSWLILEIFSFHARTREAITQVELARLKYALPRLTKMWGHLSRQRGGIGMKDVGETQIQLDKRIIRDQITKLERKLKHVDQEKKTQRKSRQGVYKAALVGYTNVGKSTLMNQLTEADALVENKLFATLDPTVRKMKKNFPYPVLLADTVGLINKLPHDLIASFKSTLDEVREADLLLKVVDISHPDYREQMETAERLLNELGADKIDSILVFNKSDRIEDEEELDKIQQAHPRAILISCKTGEGLDPLRQAIIRCYESKLLPYTLTLTHSQVPLISMIRKLALIISEDYQEEEVTLSLRLPPGGKKKLQKLLDDSAITASP